MQIYNCVNQGVKWTPARWLETCIKVL